MISIMVDVKNENLSQSLAEWGMVKAKSFLTIKVLLGSDGYDSNKRPYTISYFRIYFFIRSSSAFGRHWKWFNANNVIKMFT